MALKGVKAEIIKPAKPKFMLSGPSGVGKTYFALNFPRPYLFDIEGGATREQYRKKLSAVNGGYFGKEQGSQDFQTILEETKELATTKHEYQTAIYDSYSKAYNIAMADAEMKGGSEYGRDKKEANKPSRQLLRWTDRIDLTVILVCHTKDKWAGRGDKREFVGTTFDGYDKFEYDLDLWLEVQMVGKERFYTVKKTRIEAFPLDYADFSKRYGKELIESSSKPLILASEEQIAKVRHLLQILKVDEDQVTKWLAKDEADDWPEMSSENIQKVIVFLEKKIKGDEKERAA